MNLGKVGDTEIWRIKCWLTLSGELVLEKVIDVSLDRISNE
jgi:hypothetical protein